jgi:hypothetical protein
MDVFSLCHLLKVRVASGFNTKNLLALTHAIPLVATRAAAAGLPPGAAFEVPSPDCGSVSSSSSSSSSSSTAARNAEAEAFARAAAELHRNASAWAAQGRAGLAAARAAFAPPAVASALAAALRAAAAAAPPAIRRTWMPLTGS